MNLLFVADARSPIAVHWVRWFVENGREVHWVSSRRADPPLEGLASFRILPLFPELPEHVMPRGKPGWLHPAATLLRHWLTPFRMGRRSRELDQILEMVRPDLLHAMRIPQEGMAASGASRRLSTGADVPLVVSVWGDDFTFHACSSPMMARLTKRTVEATDALHSDCKRDIRMAKEWGLRIDTKTLVTPGNGGIQTGLFFQGNGYRNVVKRYSLPMGKTYILNPRGIRGVARTDTFFKIIPTIVKEIPDAHFLGLRMAGSAVADSWVKRLGVEKNVTLLPALQPTEMAELFRASPVVLSLTEHDGVPNVLLEAMACGSFPICGDLESIREWIDDGVNGLLVDPADTIAVKEAVLRVCRDADLRRKAAERNKRIIRERAEWNTVMHTVDAFYQDVAGSRG